MSIRKFVSIVSILIMITTFVSISSAQIECPPGAGDWGTGTAYIYS